jgi:hypothetical protein
MVIVIVAVLVPLEFVALILPVYAPAVVGVPENIPVAVSKLMPGTTTVVP